MSADQTLRAVAQVLSDVWDPIDIRSTGEPADEYSAYAAHVADLLQRGTTDAEIAAYLAHIETAELGMVPTSTDHRLRAAAEARAAFTRALQ